MKIKLIRPNYRSHLITPPVNLGYLSSVLKEKNHTVEIIDGLNHALGNDEILRLCQGADLIGINCLSDYFPQVAALSKELKKHGHRVVIGGPHATILPDLTLKETGADFVVAGEGEITICELAEALENDRPTSEIPGLITPNGPPLKPRGFITDLDSLPYPDWDQIDPGKCKRAPHGGIYKKYPIAPLLSSRGCPYVCGFCASPKLWARKIRYRSTDNVLGEIELLVQKFHVGEIHFIDDNFTQNKERLAAICEEILRRNIKVHWALPNGIRVDSVNLEILKLMRKSGCYSVAFGIESGDQGILDRINKKIDLVKIERAVGLAHQAGLITQGFFIFGLPGETHETMKKTVDLALKLPLDKAQFLIFDLLPGSGFWDELKPQEEKMKWEYRSFQEPSWIPPNLTYAELVKTRSNAFRKFFMRPRSILFLLRHVKLEQFAYVIRRLRDFAMLRK